MILLAIVFGMTAPLLPIESSLLLPVTKSEKAFSSFVASESAPPTSAVSSGTLAISVSNRPFSTSYSFFKSPISASFALASSNFLSVLKFSASFFNVSILLRISLMRLFIFHSSFLFRQK